MLIYSESYGIFMVFYVLLFVKEDSLFVYLCLFCLLGVSRIVCFRKCLVFEILLRV